MSSNSTLPNPLLCFDGLPKFNEISPEHVTPAMDELLNHARNEIESLAKSDSNPNWENFLVKLEDMQEKISRTWSQVGHLNSVVNTPELREAYNINLPKLTDFFSDLSQDERLYSKYKELRNSKAFDLLTSSQKKIVENELRDFRLGGAELPSDKKLRFKQIQEDLSRLSTKFEENLLDTINNYAIYIENKADLEGLPDDSLQAASDSAKEENKTGYKFTLHSPSYMPVLQYCGNRNLRETLYRAYATRASEFGNPDLDNSSLISDILKLKSEEAQLLGYKNYAEVSLASKMANTPGEVISFLDTVAKKARPFAISDMQELTAFSKQLGLAQMEAWDVAYVSEKLREQKYSFSDQEVKKYFPEQQVLKGLFKVIETIFCVQIKISHAQTWHQDVKFFEITNSDGSLVGQFYLDLYARNNKRGGAWMDEAITRRKKTNTLDYPVAFLTCNFSPPIGDKQALFTHDEVITLFHEFGHGLHHMLTQVDEYSVSGIKGVEWDAVELPSQFMENYCWEWEVLKHMTKHVETGENLPRHLFDKMVAAKNFQAGMQTLRQVEFALFDMRLHSEFDPFGKKTVTDLIEEVRDEISVIRPPKWNRFPNSFSHIFAGGYAAGYYSYKWAEVLSADAYSMFEENGVLSPEIGHRFWREILSKGGSRPALESFVAFRGRDPSIDALLRHNGMFS